MIFGRDFDTLIERFSPNHTAPIALGVSGGSDSLALLHLTSDWAKRQKRAVIAFTVDHGLRSESASEAAHVAQICQKLGFPHETLTWDTPKPTQAAARRARYLLMSEAAGNSGAKCLLLGHTFDDVLETAIIRRRRGVRDSSVAGPVLASPAPVWPQGRGLTLLRPLLGQTRSTLRHKLRGIGQPWIDDPSNANKRFERVRVRDVLSRHPTLKANAANQVARLQRDRGDADSRLALALDQATIHADGLISIEDSQPSVRATMLLLRAASGGDHDARAGAVARMLGALDQPGHRQTIGGAWVQRTQTGFSIGRDPAAITRDSGNDIFDGRFVRDPQAQMIPKRDRAYLVRETGPAGSAWREILSERIAHAALCHQTPRLSPVQR